MGYDADFACGPYFIAGQKEQLSEDSSAKIQLLVMQSPHSGDRFPITTAGLRMSEEAPRIAPASGWRLRYVHHTRKNIMVWEWIAIGVITDSPASKGEGAKMARHWDWCYLTGFHKSRYTGYQRAQLPLHADLTANGLIDGVNVKPSEREIVAWRGLSRCWTHSRHRIRAYNITKRRFGRAKISSK